ncbi:hypothetical protein BT96DRAFT_810540 [Gymnopus androsaceus JB14]|uniref:Fe2OG dioxygenase domain-containing protein n=1 Tax=Gymnopus androsaceus JB14 TaxID=1447944 RepID=A0A6A4I9R6_9AGAR|nr:hypothetical protein BT96DRAFT_810540 [Gymnopus androsaceus JB14]
MSSRRLLSSLARSGTLLSDFHFISDFFSVSEQRTLLSAALLRLDAAGSRRFQKKRKTFIASSGNAVGPTAGTFLPDEYYEFSEGHYDGVIHSYREMHLTSWPILEVPGLSPVLNRLHSLLPSPNIQTHLLHLSSIGEISPHVDNVSASGRWILGVSLGASRVLRLENCSKPEEVVELLLPSGSVYIQRDAARYEYKHSILQETQAFGNGKVTGGQRISIIIRVSLFYKH